MDNIGGWLTTVVSRVCLTRLDAVLAFRVHDGRITAIDALAGARIAGLGLDALLADSTPDERR